MKSISGYCLVDLYVQSKVYIGLVNENAKEVYAFYFKPNSKNFSFDKVPVCINTLNFILPEMCEIVGLKRKTAHSLSVTCASSSLTLVWTKSLSEIKRAINIMLYKNMRKEMK